MLSKAFWSGSNAAIARSAVKHRALLIFDQAMVGNRSTPRASLVAMLETVATVGHFTRAG